MDPMHLIVDFNLNQVSNGTNWGSFFTGMMMGCAITCLYFMMNLNKRL